MTGPVFLLLAYWVLMVIEPDWYLTRTIGGAFYRIPTLVMPVLAFVAISRRTSRSVYWPLIIVVLLHLGASIYAENAGYAREPFKFVLHMLVLFSTTVALIKSPARYQVL